MTWPLNTLLIAIANDTLSILLGTFVSLLDKTFGIRNKLLGDDLVCGCSPSGQWRTKGLLRIGKEYSKIS